ncbi:sorbosone dehydrogenase family protein [Crocosphaera sp. UHCC 0190]|uniref:PQQ-dependent sugar dehydrogenase n=1 Tax=Crocosphaera sp. UHCC 0190 TaxID=3110246 RepID=UPI002B1F38B6|nr:sorbosone dehydrogenase family protein [Crocosphaera sp. UHCC 0190]MEA5509566.1 sorbosone dehydrogenase family protein [Crocosphaera sp. UHCC 0190]
MNYSKCLVYMIILFSSACQSKTVSFNNSSEKPDKDVLPKPKISINIQSLKTQPIEIKIENLPPPFASNSASKPPQVIPIPSQPILQVADGFKINVFADNLDHPRWLALTPNGEVLVTETRQNQIRLLKDINRDGVADDYQTFAKTENGLDIPFGMAFTDEYFFLGNHNAVRRYTYQKGQKKLQGKGDVIIKLPGGGYRQHWTRNIIVSPDNNKLYVSIGSKTNVDVEKLPRASVQMMNLDGSNQETFAAGLRNPVGLDFQPITQELYTTVNERDGLGDDLVPDYFTRIQKGEFYGWPFAYLSPRFLDPRQQINGQSSNPELAAKTQTPDVLFQSHSAALGLKFYTGKTFPKKYQNGAFVAFRGSWNRNQGTGYKLVFIPFDENSRPRGYYEDFITGFLEDSSIPSTWGRPVGLLVLPDGSLLFTEEANGRIYRIQYE